MKQTTTNTGPPRFPASKIHLDVVRSYVINHCMGFSWAQKVLGSVRARDYSTLLKTAELIDESLISSVTLGIEDTEYPSAAKFLAASQFVALVSKYQFHRGAIPGLDPDARAIADFRKAERRNSRLNKIFRAHLNRGTERHWSVPLVRAEISRVLGRTPHYEDIFDKCDFSGGASYLTSGQVTHLAAKLGGVKISGSKSALDYFKLALRRNSSYSEQFLERKNGMICYDYDALCREIDLRFEETDCNIISVVPKKAKSGRTIGKEPEIHNYLQKGIDLCMRQLIKDAYGIDLSEQRPNQILAWRGSLDNSCDPYVTLDVKGASNSVLREYVRSVVPPRWYRLLDDTRSHSYIIDGQSTAYEMFCSMGNGFCFPLETLIFAAICKVAAEHCHVRPDFRCYGDDIVVRQSVALVVKEILEQSGFALNTDKSFVFGKFRESCGANWYGGLDVTPGYYKEPVQSLTALHAQHNSLARCSEVQEILRNYAPKGKLFLVPRTPKYDWVTDQAFKVDLEIARFGPKTYMDRRTQTMAFVTLVSSPNTDREWEKMFSGKHTDYMALTAGLRGSDSEGLFHLRKSVRVSEQSTARNTSIIKSKDDQRAVRQAWDGVQRYVRHGPDRPLDKRFGFGRRFHTGVERARVMVSTHGLGVWFA